MLFEYFLLMLDERWVNEVMFIFCLSLKEKFIYALIDSPVFNTNINNNRTKSSGGRLHFDLVGWIAKRYFMYSNGTERVCHRLAFWARTHHMHIDVVIRYCGIEKKCEIDSPHRSYEIQCYTGWSRTILGYFLQEHSLYLFFLNFNYCKHEIHLLIDIFQALQYFIIINIKIHYYFIIESS